MTNIRTTRSGRTARLLERHLKLGAISLGLGAMAACNTNENPIEALTKGTPPDEFAVISHAPLDIPKTTSLPEPAPGERSRVEPDPQGDAIRALTGGTAGNFAAARPSQGEQVLLGAADAATANPAIRNQLEQDNAGPGEDAPYEPPSIAELLLEPGAEPIDSETLIDPDREARRLQTGGISAPVNTEETAPESGAAGDGNSGTQ